MVLSRYMDALFGHLNIQLLLMDIDPKNQCNEQGTNLNCFARQYGVDVMHGYTTGIIEHKSFFRWIWIVNQNAKPSCSSTRYQLSLVS